MMGSLSAILSSTTASEQEINDALTNALFSMEKMSSSSSPSIELLEYLFVLLQRFISAEITSKTSRLLAYILPTVPFATIVEKYKVCSQMM